MNKLKNNNKKKKQPNPNHNKPKQINNKHFFCRFKVFYP